jgi:hypothetical protein
MTTLDNVHTGYITGWTITHQHFPGDNTVEERIYKITAEDKLSNLDDSIWMKREPDEIRIREIEKTPEPEEVYYEVEDDYEW